MNINATLLGQMITFAIFVWFTLKFVWPMIQSAMEERKKKILDGLNAAEKGHEILKDAEKKSKICLKEAKEKCDGIIANANKQAAIILEDARNSGLDERLEIVNSGHKQIEQEINQVKLELQTKMAELIINGAEKVLIKSINPKEHANILERFMKKL